MKKVQATNSGSILDDVRAARKEVREDAMSVVEIASELLLSISSAYRFAKKQVECGVWKMVWKKYGRKYVPAYVRANQ